MNFFFIFHRDHLRRQRSFCVKGFSLVEVVLALGIVTFALLSIVGITSHLMESAKWNFERQRILSAVDSLRGYLNEQDFQEVYEWAREGNTLGASGDARQLAYLVYDSDVDGTPQSEGTEVRGQWFEDMSADYSSYRLASRVPWIKASLRVAPVGNPGGLTTLPDLASFDHSWICVQADFWVAPDLAVELADDLPTFTTNLVIRRR